MNSLAELKLHIVAFDIPDPPDYGGAIDVFYKVKNLAEAGVKIILHCPQYKGRLKSAYLEEICTKVFYYPRLAGWKGCSFQLPYSVFSRRHSDLLKNLEAIDAPVWFDSASTSFFLDHPALSQRVKILRPQNVEQQYFRQLARREHNWVKKIFYLWEARQFQRYEDCFQNVDAFFTVAYHDHDFFQNKYPDADHEYLPSFQPYQQVESRTGTGDYGLYHGNMGLAENREAALFLLREVLPYIDFPFILAGRNPDKSIYRESEKCAHCTVVANPDDEAMQNLIRDAQFQILPTFQNTGLKLKLLNSLFKGRHVIVNSAMIYGTGLGTLCHVGRDTEALIQLVQKYAREKFTNDEKGKRSTLLAQHYDNKKNAERVIAFLRRRLP